MGMEEDQAKSWYNRSTVLITGGELCKVVDLDIETKSSGQEEEEGRVYQQDHVDVTKFLRILNKWYFAWSNLSNKLLWL